ncbi:CDP-alcohol phosphatidyltransferase [Ordospora colligata]|uniref:CDP-alcohol phosphatidyltransferase n=1 Tax=Ordospora colligata OC4 TaxID=1354746 RepID=A0A0B2UIP1_9MICR|nr:CDP-alcohol phosphatidyltransferase [Ordospora colligata OC4]KHN68830.1 CDP-alcohol phosphatidyltransferase [Ordospora colligata OC4]TBU13864.1 CDP-alcohol phosphatidyltransferase [Ordospora colligata]TBU14053.1 CDP-alcohol phosphatidyltransferase [Ordospora colligata]TBU17722.1 CDP-alcohol phosphatidyltransferase [Ordospora colligata]
MSSKSSLRMKIRPEEISNMKSHRFVGIDNSILSKYVIRHYTKWLINKIPESIAPNMLTLMGFAMMLLSLALTLVFDPYLNNSPRFLALANFLLMFGYFTCDNLDGAQARRTGSGSPLGQLFDHGVDSFSALISSIALSSSLGLGISQNFLVLLLAIMIQFYIIGLEEKFTGQFVLGKVNGASEGIALVLLLHLLSFVFGQRIFQIMFSDVFLQSIKKVYMAVFRAESFQAISVVMMTILIFNFFSTLYSIESKMKLRRRILLYVTLGRVMLFVASFIMLFNMLCSNDLWMRYLNILMFGEVFSIKYTCEVYSYVVKRECMMYMPVYLMYVGMSIIFSSGAIDVHKDLVLVLMFSVCSAYCGVSVYRIIETMTDVLGIEFLRIAPKSKKE